jgi:hypothetical protein
VVYFKAEATDAGGMPYRGAGDSGGAVTAAGKQGIALVAVLALRPTADIEFVKTDNHSNGLALEELELVDETHANWTLTLAEKAEISFGVWKEAGQTIRVEEPENEERVSLADGGVTVAENEAGDELVIYTVKTERWDPETRTSNLFYGTGDFTVAKANSPAGTTHGVPDSQATLTFAPITFDLVVSEEDYDSKTVSVTINVEPDLTGVAVFKVEGTEGNERLARVPNLPKWKSNAGDEEIRLIDAIAWVDTNNTGGEWLIRVESSEQIPKTIISCRAEGADTEIRLRGYGEGEKAISHNGITDNDSNRYYNATYLASPNYRSDREGIINLFSITNRYDTHGVLALALEDKVTIMGEGYDSTPSAEEYYRLIEVGRYKCVFIMRAGSRLTGHNRSLATSSLYSVVYVVYQEFYNNQFRSGKFMLEGGSIDHNKFAWSEYLYTQGSTIVGLTTSNNGDIYAESMFFWTGGSVGDNVRYWAPDNGDKSGQVENSNIATVSLYNYKEENMNVFIPQ